MLGQEDNFNFWLDGRSAVRTPLKTFLVHKKIFTMFVSSLSFPISKAVFNVSQQRESGSQEEEGGKRQEDLLMSYEKSVVKIIEK